jgi:hypothetical protein
MAYYLPMKHVSTLLPVVCPTGTQYATAGAGKYRADNRQRTGGISGELSDIMAQAVEAKIARNS